MHCKKLSKAKEVFPGLTERNNAYRNRPLPKFSPHLIFEDFDVIKESIGVIKNGRKRF